MIDEIEKDLRGLKQDPIAWFLAKQLILLGGHEADDFTIDFVLWASTCSANTQQLTQELLEEAWKEL